MYCSNCGKKLSPDDFFCSNCGTPVLRQGLFDDDNAHEDAFDETRLFTAEELGKFLSEDEALVQDDANTPSQQPAEAAFQAAQEAPKATAQQQAAMANGSVTQEKIAKSGAAAKAAAVGAASAFAGKFKSKLGDMKAKQAEKKQTQAETQTGAAQAAPNMAVEPDVYAEPVIEEPIVASEKSDGPVSIKKVILPVIVLGVIIGLVIGLVLIQPWKSSDGEQTTPTDEQTAVSTIMLVE